MKTSNIIVISIVVFIYTFLLAFFGCFGETLSNAARYFVGNILPIIGVVIGYFFSIFIPVRVIQALQRNKEENDARQKEELLNSYSEKQKYEAEQIRKLLNEKDEL